ncbi:hypothetical protein J4558_19515 [Leptolyngbya sp. 15MV]|nr:hypothetical protein J4558_19515 [Leptolyngbya sp. 15MV]
MSKAIRIAVVIGAGVVVGGLLFLSLRRSGPTSAAASGVQPSAPAGSAQAREPWWSEPLPRVLEQYRAGAIPSADMTRFLADDVGKRRIGVEEATFMISLVETAKVEENSPVTSERWAIALMGDRLRRNEVNSRARPMLEDAIERAMRSESWRLRAAALTVAVEADLHRTRPSVVARMREMTKDRDRHIAAGAEQLLHRHVDRPPER